MIYGYLLCPNGHETYVSGQGTLKVNGADPTVRVEFIAICPQCGEMYTHTRSGIGKTPLHIPPDSGTRTRT